MVGSAVELCMLAFHIHQGIFKLLQVIVKLATLLWTNDVEALDFANMHVSCLCIFYYLVLCRRSCMLIQHSRMFTYE